MKIIASGHPALANRPQLEFCLLTIIYIYIYIERERERIRRCASSRNKFSRQSLLSFRSVLEHNCKLLSFPEICAQVPGSLQVDETSLLGSSGDISSSPSIGGGGQDHGPEISFEARMIPIQECAAGACFRLSELFSRVILFSGFQIKQIIHVSEEYEVDSITQLECA